jgi:opacity protein-like surface antigen
MKKYLLILTILVLGTAMYAGDEARKGTTGADQLLVPVGARGIATGGAMLSSLSGLESVYYNPAGLDQAGVTEVMFNYMSYIADINVSYFAVSTSFGEFGSAALSFKTFDFGDIPVTTSDFPDGTGETYSPTYLTIGLSYSKVLTDRISVGTNLKLISETIENTSATGFAMDAGVQYRFSKAVSIAAVVKNIGTNMSYSGEELRSRTTVPGSAPGSNDAVYEVVAESFQIPSYFELSASYNLNMNEQNNLLLGSTYTANNALEDMINLGAEYSFMNTFFIRGGYTFLVENSDQNTFGFTAGAGVDYEVQNGLNIVFDYAFRDVKEFPTANHIFTVKLSLL